MPIHTQKQSTIALLIICLSFYKSQAQVTTPSPYNAAVPINYIRTWDLIKPQTDANSVTVAAHPNVAKMATGYYDGLGRKIQTVVKQGSQVTGVPPKDLVTAILYDDLGREIYNYLPFAANETGGNAHIDDGLFKANPFQQQAIFSASAYPADQYFYGKRNYESSPLNRVSSTYSPGNSWAGSETALLENDRHAIRQDYHTNTSFDSVRIWNVDMTTCITTTPDYFPAGTLYKTVTTDEHNNQVVEYTDKQSKIVMRKVQISSSPSVGHTGWICTYYVYDDLSNIRLIIPPKATKELNESNWTMDTEIRDGLCFRYEYDERNRTIVKKIPGAAEVRLVYDARDRIVLSQDGNQRAGHQWLYTVYDGLNRPTGTGLIKDETNYDNHQYHRTLATVTTAYPNLSSYVVDELSNTFYDNYNWRSAYGNPLSDQMLAIHNADLLTTDLDNFPYPEFPVQMQQATGLITGERSKILNTNNWLYTVNIYDSKARIIQVQSTNLSNGSNIITTQFTWAGLPYRVVTESNKLGLNSQTTKLVTQNTYDNIGRLVKVEKKASNSLLNSGSMPGNFTKIAEHTFDAMGRLKKTIIGNNLDSLLYDYNIRGWMLGMNRKFIEGTQQNYYGYELSYDNLNSSVSGTSYTSAQFNGNIGGTIWKSKGDGHLRKYDFSYDALNRLLSADFNQFTAGNFNKSAGIDFSVILGNGINMDSAYDYNGNIQRLRQWGLKGFNSSLIDDLNYTYLPCSNQLKNIIDAVNDPQTKLGDFRSSERYMTALGAIKTISVTDYSYDPTGNLINDQNKDMVDDNTNGILYNYLSLPEKIIVKNLGYIEFTYDAKGNKLKKTVVEIGKPDEVFTYYGNFIFKNDTLQYILQEDGRLRPKGDSLFAFDYFIKDHLANVRLVLSDENDPVNGYQATLESGALTYENLFFSNLNETQADKPNDFDTESGNQKVSKLFNASGNDRRIGPGIVLKVMAGDTFRAGVKSWYQAGSTNTDVLPGASSFVSTLATAFTGGLGGIAGHGTIIDLPQSGDLTSAIQTFVLNNNTTTGTQLPKAYLNYVLLDGEQFKLVESNSGAIAIPDMTGLSERQACVINGGNEITVTANGFLYIYVSNESQGSVYFDDLSIMHNRGPLLEETHYYPFGLIQAGISTKALMENGYPDNSKKYTSQELNESLGVNFYEFTFRQMDPQIGRFTQIDHIAEKYNYNSTYAYAENRVINSVDLEGLESKLAIAGKGTDGVNYTTADNNSFDARAKKLEKIAGFTALQASTGDQIVNQMVAATATEGSISSVVFFSHGFGDGLILNSNQGLYIGGQSYGDNSSANINDIQAKVASGDIKFEEGAVMVFGACNACSPQSPGYKPMAESVTEKLGITTYAADGYVYPEIVNGKETGRLKTDGTFTKLELWQQEIKDFDPETGKTNIIKVGPVELIKTNVGKVIDPKELTPQTKQP